MQGRARVRALFQWDKNIYFRSMNGEKYCRWWKPTLTVVLYHFNLHHTKYQKLKFILYNVINKLLKISWSDCCNESCPCLKCLAIIKRLAITAIASSASPTRRLPQAHRHQGACPKRLAITAPAPSASPSRRLPQAPSLHGDCLKRLAISAPATSAGN